MARYGFVRHSETPFKFKSGVLSNVYVFGREDLTDHPDLELLVGESIASYVIERGWPPCTTDRQPCLIGIPTAGTALAQAAAMWTATLKPSAPAICHRIMREALKAHGADAHQGNWVNGRPDFDLHTYWLLDNVVTDGQSKIEASERLEQDGYRPKQYPCLIFVDRQQGAVVRLTREGFEQVHILFNLLDLTYAFSELGLWPRTAVAAVEAEIREHSDLTREKAEQTG